MSDKKPGPPAAPQLTVDKELALGEYANFVSIAHNFSEVLLDFGRTRCRARSPMCEACSFARDCRFRQEEIGNASGWCACCSRT